MWVDSVCSDAQIDLLLYSDCVYYDVINKNSTSSSYYLKDFGESGIPQENGDCSQSLDIVGSSLLTDLRKICYPSYTLTYTNNATARYMYFDESKFIARWN
jgi:hypothetical protein